MQNSHITVLAYSLDKMQGINFGLLAKSKVFLQAQQFLNGFGAIFTIFKG